MLLTGLEICSPTDPLKLLIFVFAKGAGENEKNRHQKHLKQHNGIAHRAFHSADSG